MGSILFHPIPAGKLGNQLPLGAPTVLFRGHGTVRSVGGIGISRFFCYRTAHPSLCFSHSCLAQRDVPAINHFLSMPISPLTL
uniref:Uncharacterized protein n=1 Tax=Picea glauca TaxID=3330 RepID=A0A117NHQ7_PICGL|nr:hypothetical protein ABT39_MTgene4104 [Picea glauca]